VVVAEKSLDPEVDARLVTTPYGRVYVSDRGGDEPAVVLMHGFPDDSRIYDRLAPELSPQRSVAFDFAGHGHSERPKLNSDVPPGYGYTPREHSEILERFVDRLGLTDLTMMVRDWAARSDSASPNSVLN
jgi:pimeloyl-ACP methyl ester carboxylesterase